MNLQPILKIKDIKEKNPTHSLVNEIDLVVVKYGDKYSILYNNEKFIGKI